MTDLVFHFLSAWRAWGAYLLLALGLLGALWSFTRWYLVEHEDPLALLHNRFDEASVVLFEVAESTAPSSSGPSRTLGCWLGSMGCSQC